MRGCIHDSYNNNYKRVNKKTIDFIVLNLGWCIYAQHTNVSVMSATGMSYCKPFIGQVRNVKCKLKARR